MNFLPILVTTPLYFATGTLLQPSSDNVPAAAHGKERTVKAIDLNDDGLRDYTIFLHDEKHRGSGGCTLRIYLNTGAGFQRIATIPTAGVPLYLREAKSSDMRDLIIYRRGICLIDDELASGHLEVLRFDGEEYQPDGTENNGTITLLPSDQKLLSELKVEK